jgi:large subunit ribosomal protein L19
MTTKLDLFNQQHITKKRKLAPGDIVKIQLELPKKKEQKSKKRDKQSKGVDEKSRPKKQIFKGIIIALKHRKEVGATFTVRGIVAGVAVERIFPLHSPLIKKIEIIKHSKVRRAKLYYLRKVSSKKATLKRKEGEEGEVEEDKDIKKEKEEEEKGKE